MDTAGAGDALLCSENFNSRIAALLCASQHIEISVDPEIKAAQQKLPIFKRKSQLLQVFKENQVVVIIGETGSGKTTQIPQYLKEIGCGIRGRIGCTQLRRVAAKAIANRVAREQGCAVGEEVGYTIRFEDCTSGRTQIQFMTDGILLRECGRDRLLSSYSAIILDESHERTVDTDLLLGVLRWICEQRMDLKLIISSATIDSARFSSFFFDAEVFNINGRMFPVDEIYCPSLSPSTYIDRAAEQIRHINAREADGDIMVFMTGERDIIELCEKVESSTGLSDNRLWVLPCYSTLPWEEQEKIFQPAEKGTRKVIIATNIAETSLTVEGIRFVIDSGWVKQKVYDSRKDIEILKTVKVSQAQAIQRAGRAGRVAPGKCFRLYSESEFDGFAPSPEPQIKRSNLTSAILLLKKMGFSDIRVLKFIDQPPLELVVEAEIELDMFGAIDEDGTITDLGKQMASFPVDPNLAKMLITSVKLNCAEEILIIVALLSVGNIFIRPKRAQREADEAKKNFLSKDGDLMTMLNVYRQWLAEERDPMWCRNNFVNGRFLHEASRIRDQLSEQMKTRDMAIKSAGTRTADILKSISSGFIQNVAQKEDGILSLRDTYRYLTLAKNRTAVYIFPGSAMFSIAPSWVVYQKVVETNKAYMRGVTPVDPEWIKEFSPSTYRRRQPTAEEELDSLQKLVASLSGIRQ